ncbi:perlucin-like protein, partial [Plectropomus leopardus]|uniref:perlucin-like protein n=1 Tax=Plectropomus leopardus TaxID=160734 RepID=UPI001C4DB27C
MDEVVFVMLLFTGFLVASSSFANVYYFIRENRTWHEALEHCILNYTDMAQIKSGNNVTEMMHTPTWGYRDKAWIGLFENRSEWTWVDGKPATYTNWMSAQSDKDSAELCATINVNGSWTKVSCSLKRKYVCDLDGSYHGGTVKLTWSDAEAKCKTDGGVLAVISNDTVNSKVLNYVSRDLKETAWIGLSRPTVWIWSAPGGDNTFTNWKDGQPNNSSEENRCAAVALRDGTWTAERCNAAYPFLCYG